MTIERNRLAFGRRILPPGAKTGFARDAERIGDSVEISETPADSMTSGKNR